MVVHAFIPELGRQRKRWGGGGRCLCKFKAGLVRIVSYRLEITCVREKKKGGGND